MSVDYSEVGRRIKKRRAILGYTQQELAELAGISKNHVSNIENAHTILSIDTLLRVTKALETTPNYLLLGLEHQIASDRARSIAARVELCDERLQEILWDFLSVLIDKSEP